MLLVIKMDLPKRKQIRLKGYDYNTEGVYFITIYTNQHKKLFSDIIVGAIRESPLHKRSLISKAIGYLKMNVSRDIHKNGYENNVWQRSFYDHIIRDKYDYLKIWNYIDTNEQKWVEDCYYSK